MGNCTGIPMYTLFLDRPTWFTEIYEIDGNTVPPFQHGSQVKMVILLFGACTMDTSRPGGQAASLTFVWDRFSHVTCISHPSKGVMKEAPQFVSVSVIDSLQLCMVFTPVMHGSSCFIMVHPGSVLCLSPSALSAVQFRRRMSLRAGWDQDQKTSWWWSFWRWHGAEIWCSYSMYYII